MLIERSDQGYYSAIFLGHAMLQRTALRLLAACVLVVGLIGTHDLFVDPSRRVANPLSPYFMFFVPIILFGPGLFALGVVLLYVTWGSAGVSQVQPESRKTVLSGLRGFFLGAFGTFVVMYVLAGLLNVIFPGGPGAIVFYLSFVLSPVAGVVGGLRGTRIGKRRAESNKKASEAACYDAGKGQRGAEE
jgi:hypothetical protein